MDTKTRRQYIRSFSPFKCRHAAVIILAKQVLPPCTATNLQTSPTVRRSQRTGPLCKLPVTPHSTPEEKTWPLTALKLDVQIPCKTIRNNSTYPRSTAMVRRKSRTRFWIPLRLQKVSNETSGGVSTLVSSFMVRDTR